MAALMDPDTYIWMNPDLQPLCKETAELLDAKHVVEQQHICAHFYCSFVTTECVFYSVLLRSVDLLLQQKPS